MRLIDADTLAKFIDYGHLINPSEKAYSENDIREMIDMMPTKDAVPLEQYQSMERTVNKLQEAINEKADAVEVVRCKDCKWYDPPHIEYNDGSREDYPARFVTIDEGMNVGGKCTNTLREYCCNHDREDPDDYERLVKFRKPQDYCSDGERGE